MEPFNAQQQPDPNMPGAVLQGAQIGQQLRGISALSGIDINDPDSLNKGIANLVRAGAADQASALMGLSITRSIYGGLPGFMAQAGGTGAQGAPAPAQAPAPGAPTDQAQAPDPTAALHAQIATDARAYSTASPADQAAMKPQLEAKYSQLGIAKPDIDAALQAVSTPEGAAQFAGMHDAHAQMHASGQGDAGAIQGALPAGMAPPAPGDGVDPYAWAKNYLSHPQWGAYEAMVKSKLGLDLGYTARAQAIMGPEFAQEAAVRNARGLSGETEAGKAPYQLDTVTLPSGATMQVPHNMALTMGEGGALRGPSPGQVSEQQAAGTAAGSAPAHIVQMPLPDGSTVSGTFAPGPNGKYEFTPVQGGGTAGAAPGLGRTPTPGAVSYQQGDAKNLTDFVGEIPGRDVNSNKIIANGQQVAAIADQVKTGRFTGALSELSRVLPGKNLAAYAANTKLLAQDLSGSFAQTLNGLAMPRLTIEAKSIMGAIPDIASPQDQIKLYGAMMAATGEYVQAHDRFVAKFAQDAQGRGETPGLTAAENAWNNGPGHASIMANPEFRHLIVGGKPAAMPFQYKGKEYVAVLPGLLPKPIIMPAQ